MKRLPKLLAFIFAMLGDIAYVIVSTTIDLYRALLFTLARIFSGPVEKLVTSYYNKYGIRVVDNNKDLKGGDIIVHDKKHFASVFAYSSLGIGESYMAGAWDCDDLEEFIYKLTQRKPKKGSRKSQMKLLRFLQLEFFNLQSGARAWVAGRTHYDHAGNKLFEAILGKNMNYSAGYWKEATDLEQSQIDKMDLIARKLMLKPGMTVLDIGCGWGSIAKHLAEKYQVKVVGITIAAEQAAYAAKRCEGLSVDIRIQDYNDLNETFDRIIVVEMIEYVGHSNYRKFFDIVHRCLKEDGIFLLHCLGVNHPHVPLSSSFLNTHFIPNCVLPYHTRITEETDGLFVIEDWQNMGFHYYKTLRSWIQNFKSAWPRFQSQFTEPERFYRLWIMALNLFAGSFRSRNVQVWEIVFSKYGLPGGYDAPR